MGCIYKNQEDLKQTLCIYGIIFFENIADYALRTEWGYLNINIDISHNVLDGGIQIEGMHDDWDSDELILVSITNNDFKNDRIYINTHDNDQHNDYEIVLQENRNLWTTQVNHAEQVTSKDNDIGGRYNIYNVGDFSSTRDSLVWDEGAENWTGWSLDHVSKAKISRSYVTGYDAGVNVYSSAVKIDSRVLQGIIIQA